MAAEAGNSLSGDDDFEEYEEIEVEEEEEVVEEEEEWGVGGAQGLNGSGIIDSTGGAAEAEPSANGSSSSSQGKLFVGGITWETTEEIFAKHFKKYGKIHDSVIMRDKHTQTPRGFGFITFADPSVVDAVLKDEHVIDGKTVEVKRTVPKVAPSEVSSKTMKIFVGGIPPSLSEDEFKEYFASYGKVVDHQIMLDHSSGRSRGFGFITFENEETVDEIMSEGKAHELGGKQVELKRAVPKKAGGNPKAGRADYGPVSGGAYGVFSGGAAGAHGYGGGYGYGGGPGIYGSGAGIYGGGYGYAAGYEYGMGFPGYGGAMYGYGAGGHGSFYSLGQPGGRFGGRYHPYGK